MTVTPISQLVMRMVSPSRRGALPASNAPCMRPFRHSGVWSVGYYCFMDRWASESTKRLTGHDSAWQQQRRCGLGARVILPSLPQSRPLHLTAFVDFDVNRPLVRRLGFSPPGWPYFICWSLFSLNRIYSIPAVLHHSTSSMRA